MSKQYTNINRREFLQHSVMAGASLALSGLIPGCAGIQNQQIPEINYNNGINLRNCNIVDVINGKIINNGTIMVRNGSIDLILDQKPFHSYGATEIDIKGQYVLPGLIDAHCHTTMPSSAQFKLSHLMTNYRQMQRNYINLIQSGVTTARDMGALPLVLKKMVSKINSGQLPGPRIKYCNAVTNVYGGHPDISLKDVSFLAPLMSSFTGQSNLWYRNTKELVSKFKKNVKDASFVKLAMDKVSILCGKDYLPSYSQEDLNIIFRLANKYNIPVAGHILTKYGFDRGLKNGLHSMEHTIGDSIIDDRDIALMVKKKCSIVPTMIMAQIFATEEAIAKLPPKYLTDYIINELKIRRKNIYSNHNDLVEPAIHKSNLESLKLYRKFGCENLYNKGYIQSKPNIFFGILHYGPKNLKKMFDAGVLIGCGTDSGVPFIYHGMIQLELEMLSRIGFSNIDVIRFATINNAKILRMESKIGSIEINKIADFMVVKENPFINLKSLKKPSLVFKEGNLVFSRNGQISVMNENEST